MTTGSAQVVLREATVADVPAVGAAERELFGPDAWSPAVLATGLTGEGRTAVVAEVDGELAGYAVVAVAGEVADLERVGVAAAQRRAGLATALLDAARTRARAVGAQRLLLEVSETNLGARAFYAAHGSVELGRRRGYYRDGADALVLELPLHPPLHPPLDSPLDPPSGRPLGGEDRG